MLKWLKQLFCIHNWNEECLCGQRYMQYCPSRRDYGDCKTHYVDRIEQYYCDYYFKECIKCGKRINKRGM